MEHAGIAGCIKRRPEAFQEGEEWPSEGVREKGKHFHPHELVFLQKRGASPQRRHHTQKALIKKEELNDGLRERKMEKG